MNQIHRNQRAVFSVCRSDTPNTMTMSIHPRTAFVSFALCLSLSRALASDWPQWRGPNRDGVAPDKPTLAALPTELKPLWRVNAGNGQAAPVIAGGKLIYLDQQADKEVAHCVELATGRELWKNAYGDIVEMTGEYGNGPRCTPLIDGDHVYVQSCGGEFRCLGLADGKARWGVSFGKDYGATWFGNKSSDPAAKETASRRHGNNGSAVIDGDRLFVPVGSPQGATLVCFDKKTGRELWRAGGDNTAYSSVMVGTLAGVRQAVHFTADALMGVDAASGQVLWRVPLKTGAKRHTVTPVIHGDSVVVSSHSVGMIRFNIQKAGGGVTAEQAWANKAVSTMLTTPVLVNGHLYALGTTQGTKADFVCVEFDTGKLLWSQPGFSDYASIMSVGDKLLALNSTGELFLLRAHPKHYEELGRLQACGKTWSFPAYADGKLYLKDGRQLMAIELAK